MSHIPTGRLNRLVKLASLGPQVGGSMLLGEGRRRAVADRMLHTLGELKGGSMKMGQIFAQIADAGLPEEFQERLSGLFDEAQTMAWEDMLPVLDAEDIDLELVEFIEHEPFAGASLGQVHQARLKDGSLVAVKIQYPDVGRALAQDLLNLQQLAKVVTGGGMVLDITVQLSAIIHALEAELDYTVELRSLQEVRQILAPWPELVVPAPVPELCSARVLTTELLHGPTLHHLGPNLSEADSQALAHLFVRAVLLPLLRADRLNADAHPGNFIVLDGPRLGLLDFGAVCTQPPETALGVRGLLRALLEDPQANIVPHLRNLGFDLEPTHRRVRRTADAMREIIAPVITGPHDFTTDRTLVQLGEYKQRHPLDTLQFMPGAPAVHLMRSLLGLMHGLRILGVKTDLSPTFRELSEDLLGEPADHPAAAFMQQEGSAWWRCGGS